MKPLHTEAKTLTAPSVGSGDSSAVCSLCGEAPHRLAECPSCQSEDDTGRLLLTTRRALRGLLAACPHECEGDVRANAAHEARRVLALLSLPNTGYEPRDCGEKPKP